MSLTINIIRSNEVRAEVVMVMLLTSISQASYLEDFDAKMRSQKFARRPIRTVRRIDALMDTKIFSKILQGNNPAAVILSVVAQYSRSRGGTMTVVT